MTAETGIAEILKAASELWNAFVVLLICVLQGIANVLACVVTKAESADVRVRIDSRIEIVESSDEFVESSDVVSHVDYNKKVLSKWRRLVDNTLLRAEVDYNKKDLENACNRFRRAHSKGLQFHRGKLGGYYVKSGQNTQIYHHIVRSPRG